MVHPHRRLQGLYDRRHAGADGPGRQRHPGRVQALQDVYKRQNLVNILRAMSIVTIFAMAATVSMAPDGFDMSAATLGTDVYKRQAGNGPPDRRDPHSKNPDLRSSYAVPPLFQMKAVLRL